MIYRVVAPHFVAGFTAGDYVRRTAPILKYMTGWRLHDVWLYCISKGWDVHASD